MEEAATILSASRLRHLFAIIITTCFPSNPLEIWEIFKESLSTDFLLAARRIDAEVTYNHAIFNEALCHLENISMSMAGKTPKELGIPTPDRLAEAIPKEILKETSYDIYQLQHYVTLNEPLLNEDQRVIYDTIITKVKNNEGCLINIDAPGGRGKTFLINLLLAEIRSMFKITLAIATSGIAATNIGGRTAHSLFKLSLDLPYAENSNCSVSKSSGLGQLLKQSDVIIWD